MSEIAKINKPTAVLKTGNKIAPIIPTDYESCWRMADLLNKSKLKPSGMETADLCVAIMMGMEIGLTPMNAVQNIAVINGKPTIWGDAALALVKGSGLVEFIEEKQINKNGQKSAFCRVKRKGEPNVHEVTFTQEQAVTAGLWGGNVWKKYPERMLQMRARAYALRDVFPDILKGIGIAEEVRDYDEKDTSQPQTQTQAQQAVTAPPSTKSLNFDAAPKQKVEAKPEIEGESDLVPDENIPSPEQIINQLTQDLEGATTEQELGEAWQMNEISINLLQPQDKAEAGNIYKNFEEKMEAA